MSRRPRSRILRLLRTVSRIALLASLVSTWRKRRLARTNVGPPAL